MCDYETWDFQTCDVWEELSIRARKAHDCDTCDLGIPKGVRYRRTSTLLDGVWKNWKHCLRCAAIVDALRRDAPETFSSETLDLACGEDWAERFGPPPLEVAELAFLLPGEKPGDLLGAAC